MEAADDIVYSVADVEDAVKKGLLSWPAIESILKADSAPVIAESRLNGAVFHMGREVILAGLLDDIYASAFRTAAIGAVVEAPVSRLQDPL
ncbi:MAG: hypothetical protein R3B68_15735 [Phycisphaerales bacterium]